MEIACEKCIKAYYLDRELIKEQDIGEVCYWCCSKKYSVEDFKGKLILSGNPKKDYEKILINIRNWKKNKLNLE